ncbi:hypothetical protein BSKO_06958 [Bryopsis sp. KO-2023]|nr:hypothetical protein BSKO_06958 [Bryopsis sp. KO-2023]
MANQGAKRRVEINKQRLKTLRIVIFAANAWYILVRLILRSSSVWWLNLTALAVTSFIYLVCFNWILKAAQPTYKGEELVDGGSDLSMGGVLEYNHDFIYLSVLAQFIGGFSDWGWLVFLSVPLFGCYKCCLGVIIPYASAPSAQDYGQEYDEKLARADRRKEKKKFKTVRR